MMNVPNSGKTLDSPPPPIFFKLDVHLIHALTGIRSLSSPTVLKATLM